MSMANFGPYLSKLRKDRNMTQKELAEKLYVSVSAVSKWERGLCIPEVFKLEELAEIFQVPVSELIHCQEGSTSENSLKGSATHATSENSTTSAAFSQKRPDTFLVHRSKLSEEERRQYELEYKQMKEIEAHRTTRNWILALIPVTVLVIVGYFLYPTVWSWIQTNLIPQHSSISVDAGSLSNLTPEQLEAIRYSQRGSVLWGVLAAVLILPAAFLAVANPELMWNFRRFRFGMSFEDSSPSYDLQTRIGGLIMWGIGIFCVIAIFFPR